MDLHSKVTHRSLWGQRLRLEYNTGFQAPFNWPWSLKIQHPIQRVHPATLCCTVEAKIEWANNGKCKIIEFPCWNSMCHCSRQRQVISSSNNQRFSFGHWIEYMTLILDSAWFKRHLHMHFYIYHRAAEIQSKFQDQAVISGCAATSHFPKQSRATNHTSQDLLCRIKGAVFSSNSHLTGPLNYLLFHD